MSPEPRGKAPLVLSLILFFARQSQSGRLVGLITQVPTMGAERRVGLYTSPHLVAVRERIRVNGEPISEENFTKYFFEVWDRLEANPAVWLYYTC